MPSSPPPRATGRDVRSSPTVSVVIAALNEQDNLPLVLEGLPPVDEVIVVDGGSSDDTVAVAREVRPDAVVIRQTRSGKGNGLACGFAVCTGDIVVTVNADGSTDPGELPRFVDALLSGADVAHGSRFRPGGGQLGGHRLDRLGNLLLSRLVNLFFGTRFTDLEYGYNAYWRSLLPMLDLPAPEARGLRRGARLWGDGPEIEPLINIRMAAQGLRVVEVASIGYPPIYGRRQRRVLRRARRALRTAIVEYVRRWRIGRAGRPAAAHVTGPQPGPSAVAREDERPRGRHSAEIDERPDPRAERQDRRGLRVETEDPRGLSAEQAAHRGVRAAEAGRDAHLRRDRAQVRRGDPAGPGQGGDQPRSPGYLTPAGADRSWRIPDEPWRGADEPWRGEDGEYHTRRQQSVTDGDARRPERAQEGGRWRPETRAPRSRDLTVILGEGRQQPLGPPGPRHGEPRRTELPQAGGRQAGYELRSPQPRPSHLHALPDGPYRRAERG